MGMFDTLKRWLEGGQKPQNKPVAPRPSLVPRPPVDQRYPVRVMPAPIEPPKPLPPEVQDPFPRAAPQALAPAPSPVVDAPAPAAAPAPAGTAVVTPITRHEPERREKPRVNAKAGTTVLVIDDSPTIVALLKRMLEQSGYEPLDAVDAETGLALALAKKPDLIFLDIVLPGMNGFEALRRLRRDPATKTTPIIMISGNELATEQFYAQRIGADDFMKKPFSRSEVFARIEKLLDADMVPRRPTPAAAAPAGAAGATPAIAK
jgi:twitching motility two-component system response regulator PilH